MKNLKRFEMKQFLRLYLKELKYISANGIFFLSILILIFLLKLKNEDSVMVLENAFILGGIIFLPLLLISIIYMESKSKTVGQLLALPTKKWYIIGSKFLAVMTIAFLPIFLIALMDTQFMGQSALEKLKGHQYVFQMNENLRQNYHSFFNITIHYLFSINFLYSFIGLFLSTFLTCSFLTLSQVVSEIVKRYKIITGVIIFLIGIYIFNIIYTNILYTNILIICFVLGIFYLVSALVIYEKYKEV
jgi:hypothetical protein